MSKDTYPKTFPPKRPTKPIFFAVASTVHTSQLPTTPQVSLLKVEPSSYHYSLTLSKHNPLSFINDQHPTLHESPKGFEVLPKSQADLPKSQCLHLFSDVGRTEMWRIFRLAFPLTLTGLSELLLTLVNLYSLGHLGTQELAGGMLGASFSQVTCYTVAMGLNTALDTLGSQSYSASRDPTALGVLFQRCLLINVLFAIPTSFLWIFSKNILTFMGQDPALANLASQFCIANLPNLFLFPMTDAFRIFFAVQGTTFPPMLAFGFGLVCHAVMNYFLIIKDTTLLGFIGAPITNVITHAIINLILIVYTKFCVKTWGGFSTKAFRNLIPYLKLGIPGVVMICADWWAWNTVTMLSGMISESTLAAQSIVFNTYIAIYQISAALGASANARVGNLLGSGCPNLAHMVSKLFLMVGAITTSIAGIALYFSRNHIGGLFNSDPNMVQITDDTFSVVSVLLLLDSIPTITMGILRGCGLQKVGAGMMLIFYYVFGLPLGAFFAFYLHFELKGLYMGIGVCLILMGITGFVILSRINWHQQVVQCQARVEQNVVEVPTGEELVLKKMGILSI